VSVARSETGAVRFDFAHAARKKSDPLGDAGFTRRGTAEDKGKRPPPFVDSYRPTAEPLAACTARVDRRRTMATTAVPMKR